MKQYGTNETDYAHAIFIDNNHHIVCPDCGKLFDKKYEQFVSDFISK